jgi:putative spermidine/putrescine transport system permease protein
MSSRGSLDRAGLGLFFALIVAPVAASLLYAALYGFGFVGLLSRGPTLGHLARLATSPEVWTSAALSLYVAAVVVGLTTLLALPLALALRERLQGEGLRYLVALPTALPGTVAALLVLQVLAGAGLLSRVAFRLGVTSGIDGFPSLVRDVGLVGVIVAHVGLAVPFFTLLLAELHRSERIDALSDLAATLGARRLQRLRYVTVPVLLRRARPSLALLFVVVTGSFEIPWLLGRQSPQMLSVLTYRKHGFFDLAQKPEAYLLAVGYTLLVFAVLLAVFREGALGDEP